MNKKETKEKKISNSDSDSDNEKDLSGFQTSKQSKEEKAKRKKELEELKSQGKDSVDLSGAIRLPNRISKGLTICPNTGTAKQGNDRDVIMSPTSFLKGAVSPRLNSFMHNDNDSEELQYEGEMIRKANETKLKKYWYCLLGKELYVYKNKKEQKHKGMHNLVGVFIKDEPEEQLDASTLLYPFSLVFPGNTTRTYYLQTKDDKEKWVNAIKKIIGYSNMFDFYEVKESLGKGKFGLVKAGVHKKTGKKVAIKIMSKKEMTVQDVEL